MGKSSWISNLSFRGLALFLRLRERSGSPRRQIEALGLSRGQVVLDYGCGVGSYTLPAARVVGPEGTVHALDIHPLAVETVRKRSGQQNLSNVKTILSGLDTGLADESVDVALLYDVFHYVSDRRALLRELHRVLEADGRLSVIPDHMSEDELLDTVQTGGLFSLQTRRNRSFEFGKEARGEPAR